MTCGLRVSEQCFFFFFLLIKDVPVLFLFKHTEFLICSKKPICEVGDGNLRGMKAFIHLFNK